MKKIIIALLVLIAAYLVGAAVFAVANGQADGKVLNVEKQIIADGDMEAADTSDWNAGNSATLTKESGAAEDGDRVLKVAYNGTTNPFAYQAQVVGKTYRVTGWARGDGTAYPVYSDSGYTTWAGTTSTEWQRFDIVYEVVGGTQARLYAMTSSSGYTEWDDLVFVEHVGKTTNAEQQLLADGDMEDADTSAWTAINSATLSKESGAAEDGARITRVTYGGLSAPSEAQTVLTIGKTYRVTGWTRGDGTASPRVADSGTPLWTGTTSTDWQFFDVVFVALTNQIRLRSICPTPAGDYTEWDDVVVTEYSGKTITGSKQLLADGDMEDAGVGDWAAISSTISKESGAAEDGERVLRIDRPGATGVAEQHILTVGTSYRVTGWARSDGSSYPRVKNITAIWTGNESTDWQYFDEVFVAQDVALQLLSMSNGSWTEFDDVTVTEYTGKTITGGKQLLADGDMEASDTSAWTAVNTTPTKEAGGVEDGKRILKLTRDASGAYVYQSVLTIGKTYKLDVWARGDGANNYPMAYIGVAGAVGTTSTEWQHLTVIGVAKSASVKFYAAGPSGYSEFDDILVTQID